MSILSLLSAPDPLLLKIADPVPCVTDEIRQLMDDMLETMYANDGMGLAANQVGVLKRVVVIDENAGSEELPPKPLKMVNPEILWYSDELEKRTEACLSVLYSGAEVTRPCRVKISYVDENNLSCEMEVDGIMATCVQHEIDHLNGILYIDHLSRLKRDLILKKLRKLKKQL